MKIKYRKVYRKINLSDYYEDSETDYIEVWVNPHREITRKWTDGRFEGQRLLAKLKELSEKKDPLDDLEKEERDKLGEGFVNNKAYVYEFFATVWKFDGEQPSIEAVEKLSLDSDESLWEWLMIRTWEEISSFRDRRKKG